MLELCLLTLASLALICGASVEQLDELQRQELAFDMTHGTSRNAGAIDALTSHVRFNRLPDGPRYQDNNAGPPAPAGS